MPTCRLIPYPFLRVSTFLLVNSKSLQETKETRNLIFLRCKEVIMRNSKHVGLFGSR